MLGLGFLVWGIDFFITLSSLCTFTAILTCLTSLLLLENLFYISVVIGKFRSITIDYFKLFFPLHSIKGKILYTGKYSRYVKLNNNFWIMV